MPGTLIDAGQGSGLTVTLAVQAGDSIAITGINFNVVGPGTCSDSQGNVYVGPIISAGGGFGILNAFAAVAQSSGSLTINMLNAGGGYAYAQYRGAGIFDQASVLLAYYTPADPSYPIGVGTGPFTYADTTVITFVSVQVPGGQTVASETGDSIINGIPGTSETFVLARSATGPGNGTVKIKSTVNAGSGNGQIPIVVITFSNAIARPGGTPEQEAFRGGVGFETETTPIGEYKAPLAACLPYAITAPGSLVAVGVSYTGCAPAIASLGAQDDYGNVYTLDINSTGNSSGIALFHTVVTNPPPAGQPFRVKLTSNLAGCPGVAYQVTAIAIGELQIFSLVSVAAAGWDHDVVASPNQTMVSATITSVPANTWLFAMVVWGPTINQLSIAWTALESYTIQQKQEFIQFFPVPGNSARIGAGAVLTKFVNSLGNYDAQAMGTLSGSFAEAGSIALLAATVSVSAPTLLCPVRSTAQIGVPFSTMLLASGGTPPYTFAIIA